MPDNLSDLLSQHESLTRAAEEAKHVAEVDKINKFRQGVANKAVAGALSGVVSGVGGYAYGSEGKSTPTPITTMNTVGAGLGGALIAGGNPLKRLMGAGFGAGIAYGANILGERLGKAKYHKSQQELPVLYRDSTREAVKSLALPTVALTSAALGALGHRAALKSQQNSKKSAGQAS